MNIDALILEDEKKSMELLQLVIQEYCPEVQKVYTATNTEEAYQTILLETPKILLFDIEVANEKSPENSLELLARIPQYDFRLIIISAFEQYALRAIKFQALDFITKPVNIQELQTAIQKAINSLKQTRDLKTDESSIIWIKTPNYIIPISVNEISFIEADDKYSIIVTKSNQKYIQSKTMKGLLNEINLPPNFVRVSKSFVVNINLIKKISLKDQIIKMENEKEITYSNNYSDFIKTIKKRL